MPGGGAAGGMGGGGSFGGSDMLSGLGDNRSWMNATADYSISRSGKNAYRSYSVTMKYFPFKWLILTASVPFQSISGFDTRWETFTDALGDPVLEYEEFHYNQEGMGDITIMSWFNVAYPFLRKPAPADGEKKPGEAKEAAAKSGKDEPGKTKPEPEKDSDKFKGYGYPMVLLGAGLKLDTGTHDEWDYQKYLYDRRLAEDKGTGEYSISDGIIPAGYQLGTGTTDILFGLYYQQRFRRFVPWAGLTYQYSGGENTVGYERSDKLMWSLGTKYIISQDEKKRQFHVSAGLSGTNILGDDTDHSENTTLLGIQEKGDVPDTGGSFEFIQLGLGYDITKYMSVSASVKRPLGSQGSDSENAFDHQFSVGMTFKF